MLGAQLDALQKLTCSAAGENFENLKPEIVLRAQLDALQKFIMSLNSSFQVNFGPAAQNSSLSLQYSSSFLYFSQT